MNYIELIKRFWQAKREHPMSANDTALYFFLIEECNLLGWKMPFGHSDRYISSYLGISKGTVRSSKDRLKEIKLIGFTVPERASRGVEGQTRFTIPFSSPYDSIKPGKSKRTGSITGSIHDTQIDPVQTTEEYLTGSGTGSITGSIHDIQIDPNIKRNETKPTTPKGVGKNQKSDSSKNKKENEKKSSSAAEKIEATPHWKILVDVWFNQYEKLQGMEPSFAGSDPRDLKQICEKLQKRSEGKNLEWTEQCAKVTLTAFINHSYSDKWLKENFLLSNLNRQLDKIISNAKQTNNGTNTMDAAFAQIDRMYGDGK